MFWYVLTIALLNICLGFALAARLGARYRAMLAMIGVDESTAAAEPAPAPAAAPAEPPAAKTAQDAAPASESPSDLIAALATETEAPVPAGKEPAPVEEAPTDQAPDTPSEQPAETEAPAAGSTEERPADAEPEEPSQTDATESGQPSEPGTNQEALAAVDSAAVQLEEKVDAYDEALIETNEKLRAQAQSPETAAIGACLASLRDATDQYLRERTGIESRLLETQQAAGIGQSVAEGWQGAVQAQQRQIDQTVEAAEGFDYEGDLSEQCRAMVASTDQLLDANHLVSGAMEEVRIEVARQGGRLDDPVLAGQTDPVTGLHTRVALEAWLHQFWEEDAERTRRLCVGTVDVDELGQINARYGRRTGDQLLRSLVRLLQADETSSLIARVGGQRFVLVFPDVESHAAVSSIERIRQTVELARFRHTEGDIRITISGAVAEATPEDTSHFLLMRLDVALQEAKRYGRNRTFAYEGRYPTPAVPPNFTLEEKVVTL